MSELGPLRSNRNLQVLLFSAVASDLGSLMATFGLSLTALDISQRAADFALVFTIGALAPVCFAPIAGPLSDRFDRKKLIIALDLVRGIAALLLLAYLAAGLPPLPAVYVTTFVLMSCEAFFSPVFFSLLPSVVEKKQIVRANALLHGSKQSVTVLAPLVGGFLYAINGITAVLLVVAAIYAAALVFQVTCLRVAASESLVKRPLSAKTILADFGVAAKFLCTRVKTASLMVNGILSHLLLFPFIMVVIPFTMIKLLGATSIELGTVQAAYGVGTICAMPLSIMWEKRGVARNLLLGLVGLVVPLCLYLLVFAPGVQELVRTVPGARVVLYAVAGFTMFLAFSYYLVFFVSFFQSEVPPEMRGRAQARLGVHHGVSRLIGFTLLGWCITADYRLAYVLLAAAVILKIVAHIPFMRKVAEETAAPAGASAELQ